MSSVRKQFLVPFDEEFSVKKAATRPPRNAPGKGRCREILKETVERLSDLQRRLYAQDQYAVLLVFQAMDAAGKDSTIRAVTSGINPAGCQVFSFKQPSKEELDHDFLWRTTRALPERGRIGIFNRSHYEEVLVVRVHPEYLQHQRIPDLKVTSDFWKNRYASIRAYERHLVRNGTVILKFWLHVSRDEQRKRFLDRIQEPEKNWKFSAGDIKERGHWEDYMRAYQAALRETSRKEAPWFAIPADEKPYMRMVVAQIIAETLDELDLRYPQLPQKERDDLPRMQEFLEGDIHGDAR